MTAGPSAVGYSLVLPPAWRKIPVRSGTGKAIRQIVDQVFAGLPKKVPRDKVTPYRIELTRQLTDAARRARQQGGADLYLPVELQHGTLVAASFIVSEGSVPSPDGDLEPAHVLATLAVESGGRPVTVGGAPAVRSEQVAPPDPDKGIEFGSRRVDYILPVPGDAQRWLIAAFSALGAGDPEDKFAGLVVELFDAIMSTFRWAGYDAQSEERPPKTGEE
ncbi:MAG: hypothetical protein ACRDN0_10825 [Trebonia sp.]